MEEKDKKSLKKDIDAQNEFKEDEMYNEKMLVNYKKADKYNYP